MKKHFLFLIVLVLAACRHDITPDVEKPEQPGIFPDYADATIPPNIAPLTFRTLTDATDGEARYSADGKTITARLTDDGFRPELEAWHELLAHAKGQDISIEVLTCENGQWIQYAPFTLHVANEEIDPYLAYRLIPPGYENWSTMGIYQRDLTSFTETPIIENRQTNNNCMNCHSFCNRDAGTMLFHMREKNAGTYLIRGHEIEKLDTKTDHTLSALVYPSWNGDGRHVAFSVNSTFQAFHPSDPNRIEVYDTASDVVVYDTEEHAIATSPLLSSTERMETFPTFSPDGRTLYFCSAPALPREQFREVRYSLCRISFDPATHTFGNQVDTLFNAEAEQRSASFPRVSPDGKHLMFTVSSYGNFSIWHKDADLLLLSTETGKYRPMNEVNSPDVESYHSWSGNSRWFVFSSRRVDGLYTMPHIAYLRPDGTAAKPFLLPQASASFYHDFFYSYNIPELIDGKVEVSSYEISRVAKTGKAVKVH